MNVKRLVRIFAGLVLIILGLVGLIVPILQGWLFLALGALVLSPDIPLFARMVEWIEKRFPMVKDQVKRIRKFLDLPETH
jgi:uncharacterized membrane protein YbaN (DUF454 family)